MSAGCEVRSAALIGGRIADLGVSAALNLATWVAGQPLAYDANGWKAATASGTPYVSDVVAIAENGWNTYNLEGFGGAEKVMGVAVSGAVKPIVALHGDLRLNLKGEDVNGTTVYSFLQTPTSGSWVVGAKVWLPVGASTKWDDTAIGTERPYGRVLSFTGPATAVESIEIQFIGIGF